MTGNNLNILFTRHAVEQMLEGAVSTEDVREILLKGVKFGPNRKGSLHARMMGIEVVYTREGDVYRIVTVFHSRK